MVFSLSLVQKFMLLPPNVKTDQETARAARSGVLIADRDEQLRQVQAAIIARADALYNFHKFEESKRYFELAGNIRDMRTELAKVRKQA